MGRWSPQAPGRGPTAVHLVDVGVEAVDVVNKGLRESDVRLVEVKQVAHRQGEERLGRA